MSGAEFEDVIEEILTVDKDSSSSQKLQHISLRLEELGGALNTVASLVSQHQEYANDIMGMRENFENSFRYIDELEQYLEFVEGRVEDLNRVKPSLFSFFGRKKQLSIDYSVYHDNLVVENLPKLQT
ncbi:hypothetical protein PCE1_003571 [Barthelona sp. PCE]